MNKGWDTIPIEEKVERLRSMAILLTVIVILLAVMIAVLAGMILHVDREAHPVKPHKTEQPHQGSAWT